MRAGRRLGKRDSNEKIIVDALRKCGVKVHHVSAKGFADLIAYTKTRGIVLLEVKGKRGTLTPAQVEYRDDGWPVVIVRSAADALAACGVTT